jgi:hypothetical protein
MSETVRGWELVCPWPIWIGPSNDARHRARFGRKPALGVAAKASATASTDLSQPETGRTAISHTSRVIKLELVFGVLVFAAWIFTLIEVAQTPDDEIRNLNKGVWIVIVLFFSLPGIVGWFVFGRPENRPRRPSAYERPTPAFPEYDRPGRAAAIDPEKDEEFLKHVRERAEEQRRRYEQQKKLDQQDPELDG